jgi:hypothetical protein
MGFSASIRDGHLLKRGRDSDGTDTDQKLYCESSDEGRTYRFSKRSRSSSSNSVEEFMGFDDEEDMVFTSQQPDFYGSLREETADSESFTSKVYYDSENFSPPFCRDNSTSTTKMPVPDDAQSSTSDSCCCCCDSCDYDDEYEDDDSDEGELSSSASTSAPAQSFINYLFEASDDDLGLPPVHCRYDDMYQNQSNAHLHAVDLDLGLDLDLDVEDHQLLVF